MERCGQDVRLSVGLISLGSQEALDATLAACLLYALEDAEAKGG
jgi:hypothetical protein